MRRLLAICLLAGPLVALPSGSAFAASAAVGTHLCTNPVYTSSSPSSEHGWQGAEVTSTDVWDGIDITQTISGCAGNSWNVAATAASGPDGGAVQSYPDTNITIPATALSTYTTLTSNERITDPPACSGNDYESAYDLWWGGSDEWSGPSTEMMIWSHTCHQVPAGTEQPGTVSLSGRSYTVWAGSDSAGNIITFKAVTGYQADDTNLLAFADYAQTNGFLPNAYLWQVGMGFEVCYTNGTQTFSLTAFDLVGNGKVIRG